LLGPRIAALRRAAGWSQAELARLLQCSPSAVGMYEQGRREPALGLLVSMANAFGVTTDYLLTGKATGPRDQAAACDALQRCVAESRHCVEGGSRFSREELAALLAAMLLET